MCSWWIQFLTNFNLLWITLCEGVGPGSDVHNGSQKSTPLYYTGTSQSVLIIQGVLISGCPHLRGSTVAHVYSILLCTLLFYRALTLHYLLLVAAANAVDAVLAATRPKSKLLTPKQRLGKILGLNRSGKRKL